jgi:hypothetical protein
MIGEKRALGLDPWAASGFYEKIVRKPIFSVISPF